MLLILVGRPAFNPVVRGTVGDIQTHLFYGLRWIFVVTDGKSIRSAY
jgi:hypothetical protein